VTDACLKVGNLCVGVCMYVGVRMFDHSFNNIQSEEEHTPAGDEEKKCVCVFVFYTCGCVRMCVSMYMCLFVLINKVKAFPPKSDVVWVRVCVSGCAWPG
jgi:hypothetical protein